VNLVQPVTITTPDGVERELRFTLGARKRIAEIFGCGLKEALAKFDAGAFPGVLWALMHNSEGKPPDVSMDWLSENLPSDSSTEVLAAIMSAATQGKTPKKVIEDLLKAAQEAGMRSIGFNSGDSVSKLSEFPTPTSGTDTSNVKLKPASLLTVPSKKPSKKSTVSSSEPSPQVSTTL
jgi:hypothetical protein